VLRDDEDVIYADFLKLNGPKKRNLCLYTGHLLRNAKWLHFSAWHQTSYLFEYESPKVM